MNTKEKQIDELATFLFHDTTCYNTCWEDDCEELAEILYNAGYRKQSEGEWIEIDAIDDGWKQYSCNCCGWNTEDYYKEKQYLPRYCPNCGAKMKGGE